MSAIDSVLTSMQSLYVPPWGKTTEQQTAAIGEYMRALNPYSDADLLEAWDRIVASHKHKDPTKTANWPGIDVWKKHLGDIQAEQNRPAAEIYLSESQILNSPNGQYALREGFGHSFLLDCQRGKRLLDRAETEKLVKGERAARSDYVDCGSFTGFLQRMRSAMDAHEARLKAGYLKEAA